MLLSKATYIAFKLQFYILSALAFPGNRTHDLGVASAMLYHLSYRKAHCSTLRIAQNNVSYSFFLWCGKVGGGWGVLGGGGWSMFLTAFILSINDKLAKLIR